MSNMTHTFLLSPWILLLHKGPDTNCYDNYSQYEYNHSNKNSTNCPTNTMIVLPWVEWKRMFISNITVKMLKRIKHTNRWFNSMGGWRRENPYWCHILGTIVQRSNSTAVLSKVSFWHQVHCQQKPDCRTVFNFENICYKAIVITWVQFLASFEPGHMGEGGVLYIAL